MGLINYGIQENTFSYKERARAIDFNKLGYEVIEPGIYSGFETAINSPTGDINIFAGSMFINNLFDTPYTEELSLNCKTTEAFTLTLNTDFTSSNNYIIARLNFEETVNDYVSFLGVDFNSVVVNDIILCKVEFNASGDPSDLDYTRRDFANVRLLGDRKDNGNVKPTEPVSSSVEVSNLNAYINGEYVQYAGGTIALPSVTSGMITLVHLDNTGTLAITNSSDAGSPTTPDYPSNKLVLAIVTRAAGSVVYGSEIENVVIDKVLSPNMDNINVPVTFQDTVTMEDTIIQSDTTASTDKDTGAIVTEGGLGVEKNINAGGTIKSSNTTDSSSKTTGSLLTEGGLGVAKNIHCLSMNSYKYSSAGDAIVSATGTTYVQVYKSITCYFFQTNSGSVTLAIDQASAYHTMLQTVADSTGKYGIILNPGAYRFTTSGSASALCVITGVYGDESTASVRVSTTST